MSSIKKLEGHHLKEFNLIVSDFLKYYNQFSPIEDMDILTRLAITYGPFWNLDNGQTLCETCHKSLERNKNVNKK